MASLRNASSRGGRSDGKWITATVVVSRGIGNLRLSGGGFLAAESEGRSARRSSPRNPSRSSYARLLISGLHCANATDCIMIEPD
jgi:hypothetical protein